MEVLPETSSKYFEIRSELTEKDLDDDWSLQANEITKFFLLMLNAIALKRFIRLLICLKKWKILITNLLMLKNKIQRGLREKGLFLSQKDFNIMEVFNPGFSCSYSVSDEQSEISSYKEEIQNNANELESTSAKNNATEQKLIKISSPINQNDNSNLSINNKYQSILELRSISRSGTPISYNFEPVSNNSKMTNKSHNTFISRNSQRMLFQDYQTERRNHHNRNFQPGRDFICTWNKNNLLGFYPIIELHHQAHPYIIDSDNDSDIPVLESSDLMRSLSMPIQHHEIEDKLIEPLGLERQPFSNLINFSKPSHNYANLYGKAESKNWLKNDHLHNPYNPRFNEKYYYADDNLEDDEDENIHI